LKELFALKIRVTFSPAIWLLRACCLVVIRNSKKARRGGFCCYQIHIEAFLETILNPTPPWRWPLWGPWPPNSQVTLPPIPDEQIRPIAERLGKQRPWLSAEENWLAAERALRQKPWRPWLIRFSGEKERSGWDWADLLLKVSVPVLILGLSTAFSIISSNRQQLAEKTARDRQELIEREQRENDVLAGFISGMQPLILDRRLGESTKNLEVRGLARALTLTTLSQLKTPQRKTLAARFLLDSGLNTKPGNLFSLREAELNGADLSFADLRLANLSKANLNGAALGSADLRGTLLVMANLNKAILIFSDLRMANLWNANLSGASLIHAKLSEANLAEAQLNKAELNGADLRATSLKFANLSGANLREANLAGANLEGANLRSAEMNGVSWDSETKWPVPLLFNGAKNIPPELKKQLGLP